MDGSQSAEEDLLSFLQPLTMPDEFTFEPRTRHFEDSSDDDVDQEPIPGPAPPAPVAPMAAAAPVAPMAPMDAVDADPFVAVVPEAAITKTNGAASPPPTETNGHKEDETVVEQDDDAIEYETPKATRKSPAKRSIRRTAAPKTRKGGGNESPRENATGLLKWFAKSSADKRVDGTSDPESDLEANVGSQVKTGKRKSRETTVSSGSGAEVSPESLNFEVVIQPLSPATAKEYIKFAPGDEIYRVLDVIKTDVPGEAWLSVEFEDGRVDQVSRSYRPILAQDEHTYIPFRPLSFPIKGTFWQ